MSAHYLRAIATMGPCLSLPAVLPSQQASLRPAAMR
jgi:hypothetical protein